MKNYIPHLLFLFVLMAAACPVLRADMGLTATRGPGDYRENLLSLDVKLAPAARLGLGYQQVSSSAAAAVTRTYSANLTGTFGRHVTAGLSGASTPEVNGERSMAWGTNIGYTGGGDRLGWGVSFGYTHTLLSEYWQSSRTVDVTNRNGKITGTRTINASGWQNLNQGALTPTLSFSFFGVVDLSLGYSAYAYDRDLLGFSTLLANSSGQTAETAGPGNSGRTLTTTTSFDYGGMPSLIDGFPDHVCQAGVSVQPLDKLSVSYTWSRTGYVLDQPEEYSSNVQASYTFFSVLRVSAGCTSATNGTYTQAGLQWVW